MLFIVSGNKRQADEYAHSIGLQQDEYKYVHNAQVLYGLPRGSEFTRVGTWYEHPNENEVNDALASLEAVEIYGVKSLVPKVNRRGNK